MIVFLDDEPHFCQAYIEYIQDAGFVVDIVTTTEKFSRTVSSATEAVIVDAMLPEGWDAGVVAFREIRRRFPDLPAILLTNRDDLELGPLDGHAIAVSKRDVLPTELLELLLKMISAGGIDSGNG